MLDRFFGIMCRAYYLIAFSVFVGCVLGYFFADWGRYEFDPDLYIQTGKGKVLIGEDPARLNVLLVGILTPIMAFLSHKIFHWVIWGKFK